MIATNPVAGAQFFKVIVELFIKHVLGVDINYRGLYGDTSGYYRDTSGYYGTVEQQERLTLHIHMLLWLKHALTPHQIRERLLDHNSNFQKPMVEYLESMRKGEFMNGTLHQVSERKNTLESINSECNSPTLLFPKPPVEPVMKDVELVKCVKEALIIGHNLQIMLMRYS